MNRFADRTPTVLVIDDLQWADRSSLDVLSYLISGFREQRLAILTTCRDEHRGEGHPLHTWFADMRRMPGFVDLHLDRFSLAGTEAQLEGLLGRSVDVELAAQVQERSGGNPYLNELLVRGLSGVETELPAAAPALLRDALLAGWHGLSAEARQSTRLLAAGGRPLDYSVLAQVAAKHGLEEEHLAGSLTEARDAGVVRPDEAGRLWFRHPLQAEILYEGLPLGQAARVHATYARVLSSLSGLSGEPPAADLAVHSHHAGQLDDAYRWSLVAADQAAELHAKTEVAIHLERACSLWEQVSPQTRGSSDERVELLRRASSSSERAGHGGSARALVEQALALTDRVRDPLLTSTLLLAWNDTTHGLTEVGKTVTSALMDAVELTEPFPDSPERALALAALAFAEHWDDLHDEAKAHAEAAVQAAKRSGSAPALAGALSIRAATYVKDFAERSMADAQEAERLARSCGSVEWLQDATIWQVNCLITFGRAEEAAELAHQVFEEVVADASEWAYFLASMAAEAYLWLGRWAECRQLLRRALAARCGGVPGASIRLTAAQLAALCGRFAEAEQHLERTRELISDDYGGLYEPTTIARAEVLLAAGEPVKALDWLYHRLAVPAGEMPEYGEDRLVDLARAAAESARAARDAGDERLVGRAIGLLDDVLGRWPAEPFTTPRPDVADHAMAKALFDAEVARCRDEADQAERWRAAIDACHTAGNPWHEADSALRYAEAMLAGGAPASAVSDLLRRAHRIAVDLGAHPLRERIEALARAARVVLREPVPVAHRARTTGALADLTAREQEILAFLVAGRTNAEIANALVISDKTVSVHVSNILRKTGTSNRVEAAALAERLADHDR